MSWLLLPLWLLLSLWLLPLLLPLPLLLRLLLPLWLLLLLPRTARVRPASRRLTADLTCLTSCTGRGR